MKSIKFGTIVLSAAVLLNGCNHIGSVQMNKALEHFIKFEQIVNEHFKNRRPETLPARI